MWLRHTSLHERRAMLAAYAGYGLDGFDFMAYTFIIPTLIMLWGMSKAEAGYIASAALVTSAIGGWGAGVLADRIGRVRVLQLTVLWFAVFTFLSGFTHSYGQLLFARAMQGFGFGGEWTVGSVLVAETIEARHRGKAAGIVQSSWSVGWAAAALAFWAANVLLAPDLSWRVILWAGILPALLIIYIRRNVSEPEVYRAMRSRQMLQAASSAANSANTASGTAHFLSIFRPPLLRTTLLATSLATGMLAAYYSVTTWLPTFLETERHLSVTGRTGYLLMLIVGSLAGYLTSAWLADALGRRRNFMLFAACGAVLILIYTHMPVSGGMLLIGFPLGFFILGIFSGMGACFAELFPSSVRGSGQGFCYSMGRAIGAACPALIGAWSTHVSLGQSIGAITVGAYALVVVSAWALPETRGRVLGIEAGAAT
ncbi:MAG TPA: MFS transporter [Steroidobacteraceae bacterium]|jgi:MFS family permease